MKRAQQRQLLPLLVKELQGHLLDAVQIGVATVHGKLPNETKLASTDAVRGGEEG